ncbi:hypothetical protein MXB_2966 [Myxobolus squamalis]|nr:hypothetical protein MXB_2966 [Myxobolus squamalis]
MIYPNIFIQARPVILYFLFIMKIERSACTLCMTVTVSEEINFGFHIREENFLHTPQFGIFSIMERWESYVGTVKVLNSTEVKRQLFVLNNGTCKEKFVIINYYERQNQHKVSTYQKIYI